MSAKRLSIKIARLENGKGLPLPSYQTASAAGLDLCAAVSEEVPVVLAPGRHAVVPTGFAIALPRGTEAQIRPRSGLAAKHGVTVLNSPGTIDADYRGEIGVILINHGTQDFPIRRGDRVAQMVIATVAEARLVEVKELGTTGRGAGGFGSTGTRENKRIAPKTPGSPTQSKAAKSRKAKSKAHQK